MSTSRKHIVVVTSEFPPQPGGIGNHAYNLGLYLTKKGFEVEVIADQRSEDGAVEHQFDLGLPFRVHRIKRYQLRSIMYVKRVITTFKRIDKASYVIATGKFSLWNVALCGLFKTLRTIAVVHGTEVNFKSFFLRKSVDKALQQFDEVIAVSAYTKALIGHLNLNVRVIPNGIDLEDWNPSKGNTSDIIGQPSLVTVGRVSSRKGQLNVIKLLPELIRQYPKLHYHCIGIPSEAAAFKNTALSLGVASHITFHGSLELTDLQHIVGQSDIFIMLSTESVSGDVEGFGIAILEANALGVPAIGSNGCGIEDAINPGVSGVLIDARSADDCLLAIQKILRQKDAFRSGALKWAEQHDWNRIIERYIEVIVK